MRPGRPTPTAARRAPARHFGIAFAALAALAAGCAAPGRSGPPEARLGFDVCARCGMLLADPATVAAARGPAGEVERWDDLECLVEGWASSDRDGWRGWVRDVESGAWLTLEEAEFAREPDRLTPMGSGLVARALVGQGDPRAKQGPGAATGATRAPGAGWETAVGWPELLERGGGRSAADAESGMMDDHHGS